MHSLKKSIACLMSLIMIITVTPFTAVTASAATVKSVSSNIEETNKKYNTAPASTFTPKTGLSEVSWRNSSEITADNSSDGNSHKPSYAPSSNVLYWPSAYVGNQPCINKKTDNAVFIKMFYPSAVLMWDGSADTYMPIVSLVQNNYKGLGAIDTDPGRTIFYGAPYDSDRGTATSPTKSANFYADRWRGIDGSNNENFNKTYYTKTGEGLATEIGFESNVLSNFETDNVYYNFGAKKENDTASFLHIDSNIDFGTQSYISQKLYWTFNSYKNTTFSPTNDNNSIMSDSTIYVVNYKPIVDAANEAANDLQNLDKTEYTPAAVNQYYDAVQALYDFDPNSYFDQNDGKSETDTDDIIKRVVECSTDIKNCVDNYNKAVENLNNHRQYIISFTDVNGNLISENYYAADSAVVQPTLTANKLVNDDPAGHYTKSYEWQPAFDSTATADVDYVETEVASAKVAHTFGGYSKINQDGVYAHSQKCTVCGYTFWQNCDFEKDNENSVPASCTQDEVIAYKCKVCGQTKTEAGKKAEDHKFTILVSDRVDPTCDTDGNEAVYKCENCDETQGGAVIHALGHNYQYDSEKNEIICSRCGDEVEISSGQVPSDYTKKTVVEPTCTHIGYTVWENAAGDKRFTDIKDNLPHNYGAPVVVKPTCTEQGYTKTVCSECHDEKITDVKAALNHDYKEVVTDPTYEAGGYTTYTCKRCGDSYVADYTDKLVKPADPTPTPIPTPTPAPTTPNQNTSNDNQSQNQTPALSPSESTIANNYGVDSATAKLIYVYLTQNNISTETSALTEKVMTGAPVKGDGDYKGSNFGLLKAQTTKLTNNSVTVKWNKVKDADGYIVYGAKCGAKSKYKVLKVVSGKTTSYTQKKLKKGTYYKYNIVAFKNINGAKVTIAVSKKVHATTLGGKYGVAKAVKVNKTKATIKKGKTFKIKASEIKKDKTIKRHRAVCYESSNTAVATVDSKGKIKALKKGKCTIYVYAQNGVYKTVNVTVK